MEDFTVHRCLRVQSVYISEMFQAFKGISLRGTIARRQTKVGEKQRPALRGNEDPAVR